MEHIFGQTGTETIPRDNQDQTDRKIGKRRSGCKGMVSLLHRSTTDVLAACPNRRDPVSGYSTYRILKRPFYASLVIFCAPRSTVSTIASLMAKDAALIPT